MIMCKKCGNVFEGNFCPNCGTPASVTMDAPTSTNSNEKRQKQKKPILKYILLGLVAVILILFLLSRCGSDESSHKSTEGDTKVTTEAVAEVTTEAVVVKPVKLTAEYTGSTDAGTVVEDPSDFNVEVTYDDGSTETVYDGYKITSKTLKAGKTAKVTIKYKKLKTVVKIKGKKVVTMGEQNALDKAYSYLDFTHFSKKGLKEQLKFEGFTDSECKYAVENCGANWKEQAAGKAQDYLDTMSFSKSGLRDQLEFEGFSDEQIDYAIKKVYK